MSASNNHLVIMAGGVGSRLWPLSSEQMPKQFIDVLGCGKSLIQLTLQRFQGIVPEENTWVVTSATYAPIVHEQLPQIPEQNILKEPIARNTAPCIAYASWKIKSINPKANIVVAPSDHIVADVEEFRRVLLASLQFAGESDAIVTLGMQPTRPDTGYGYIQIDRSEACTSNSHIYRIDTFREKPDLETAKEYVSSDNFYWNAGIFIWNVSTIVNALRIYANTISNGFERLLNIYGTPQEQEQVDSVYMSCPSISIDYAVLENADEVFCYPSSFGWSDVGTWQSLHDNSELDLDGNSIVGDVDVYETKNSIIRLSGKKKVVLQGLDGYIVAEYDGSLLVCRLDEEQRIRDFSTKKKTDNNEQ